MKWQVEIILTVRVCNASLDVAFRSYMRRIAELAVFSIGRNHQP